ncbi:MAG: glycosyltransferase [Bacteroidales bacterium]|nr:glycosyltransferase [Bacteroidales bacterium]
MDNNLVNPDTNSLMEGGKRKYGKLKFDQTEKPLISIITVVFNGSGYLEQAILSVINQSYSNIEYIIIDGGSTDGTLDIIRKYDDKIDFWISEPDHGLYDAMNKGINHSAGSIIGLINSDDCLNPGIAEKIAKCFSSNPEIGFTYGAVDLIRETGLVYGRTNPFPATMMYGKSLKEMPFAHPSCFIAKRVYDQIGLYDLTFPLGADYDLILRMIENGFKGIDLNESVSKFRDGGKSGGIKTYIETKRLQKKHGLSFVTRYSIFYASLMKLAIVSITPFWIIQFIKRFRKKSRHSFR